jgi:hypothetical protein
MDFKFIFSDNGTLSDKTIDVANYHGGAAVLPIVSADDALFIGVRYPLNSFYFKSGVVNDQASSMAISYWDGKEFTSMVELIDETAVSGVTLAQSGHITFVPDRNEGMAMEDTQDSSGNENVTGLGDVNIYYIYWYKITFSAF